MVIIKRLQSLECSRIEKRDIYLDDQECVACTYDIPGTNLTFLSINAPRNAHYFYFSEWYQLDHFLQLWYKEISSTHRSITNRLLRQAKIRRDTFSSLHSGYFCDCFIPQEKLSSILDHVRDQISEFGKNAFLTDQEIKPTEDDKTVLKSFQTPDRRNLIRIYREINEGNKLELVDPAFKARNKYIKIAIALDNGASRFFIHSYPTEENMCFLAIHKALNWPMFYDTAKTELRNDFDGEFSCDGATFNYKELLKEYVHKCEKSYPCLTSNLDAT